jgi:hypothetical protein
MREEPKKRAKRLPASPAGPAWAGDFSRAIMASARRFRRVRIRYGERRSVRK